MTKKQLIQKTKDDNKPKYLYKKIEIGKRGYHFSTELFNLNNFLQELKKEVHIEIRDSINNLKKQNVCVELYSYNFWVLNKRLGYTKKSILDIIEGDTNINLELNLDRNVIQKKSKNMNNHYSDHKMNIKFKCYFQEICDFRIFFDDWGGAKLNSLFSDERVDIIKKDRYKMRKLKAEIRFINNNGSKAETEYAAINEIKELYFKNNIFYRGCLQDLERENLQINIITYDEGIFKYCFQPKKKIFYPLAGISNNSYFKKKFLNKKSNNDIRDTQSTLWGKITIDSFPRYFQKTDASEMSDKDVQFCLHLVSINLNNIPSVYKNSKTIFICIELNGKVFQTNHYPITTNLRYNFNNEIFYFFLDKKKNFDKLKRDSDKKEYIEFLLKQNSQAEISIWIEDYFGCRDFLGKVEISLLDILTKGKKSEVAYTNKNMNLHLNYFPKKFSNAKKIGYMAIDSKLEFSINYEIWFFPEDFSKIEDLSLPSERESNIYPTKYQSYESIMYLHSQPVIVDNYKKKLQLIEREDPKLYKIRFFGFENKFVYHRHGSFLLNNKIYNSKKSTENLNHIIKGYYVNDQFGNLRILNSYLTKLTIETHLNDYAAKLYQSLIQNEYELTGEYNVSKKINHEVSLLKKDTIIKIEDLIENENSLIDKFKPGIGKTIKSYMHFVSCIRFSDLDIQKGTVIINSPEFVLKNRKGSVFEHTILLACLLINFYNQKNIELIDFEKEKEKKSGTLAKSSKNSDSNKQNFYSTEKYNFSRGNNNNKTYGINSVYDFNSNKCLNSYDKLKNEESIFYTTKTIYENSKNINNESLFNDEENLNNSLENSNKESENNIKLIKEKQNPQEKIVNVNFRKEKYYYYTRKELRILEEFGIQKPEIEMIEKKEKINGVCYKNYFIVFN